MHKTKKYARDFPRVFIVYLCFSLSISATYANAGSKPVTENKEKFLVSIVFNDNSSCIGALVGRLTIATSNICLERFGFANRIYKQPCKVYAGVSKIGKDLGIWRYCVGNPKSYIGDDIDEKSIEFNDDDYSRPTHIIIDLPFDTLIVTRAKVDLPSFRNKEDCVIYGYNSTGKAEASAEKSDSSSNAESQSGNKESKEPQETFKKIANVGNRILRQTGNTSEPGKILLQTDAEILPLDDCRKTYREYMDNKLPRGQYCVLEGGIEDLGRILICSKKVVGVVADDIIVNTRGDKFIYAYTVVRAGSLSAKPTYELVIILVFYFAAEIASDIF